MARTTKEFNKLTDEQLAEVANEVHEALVTAEIEATRLANLRYNRYLGLIKRDETP